MVKSFGALLVKDVLEVGGCRTIFFVELHLYFESFDGVEEGGGDGGRGDGGCQIDHVYYERIAK